MKTKFKLVRAILLISLWMTIHPDAYPGSFVPIGHSYQVDDNWYALTPNEYWQSGVVWYDTYILLTYDFDMTFEIYVGDRDEGADGVAFVMQPNGIIFEGNLGEGIGYKGISPSIAVEYDTWQNDDPWYDHIAVQKNGDVYSSGTVSGPVEASSTSYNIEDGYWHSTRITWEAASQTLTVYFDGNLRLIYSYDIVADPFNGNPLVYWGISGGTGAEKNLQQFKVVSLNFQEGLTVSTTSSDESCNNANDGTAEATPHDGIPPYTFNGWYVGSDLYSMDNPVANLEPGLYVAKYTDDDGFVASANVFIQENNNPITCYITPIPSIGNFTGGPPDIIYLGYGPQSVNLSATVIGEGTFAYSWTGSSTDLLSCTDCESPSFTPVEQGNYLFSLTVTNESDLCSTCDIVICVIDIIVPGTNMEKIFLCHVPPTNPNNPLTLAISPNGVPGHIPLHPGDHLGRCEQSCEDFSFKSGIIMGEMIVSDDPGFTTILYPNPFIDEISLTIETDLAEFGNVEIYDLEGRMVCRHDNITPNLPCKFGKELNKGLYLGVVRQGHEVQYMKIVKAY